MIIQDLFSHKIHSSRDEWAEKLIDIATIFAGFDGDAYDRDAIEKKFKAISPRASKIARDPSKYRDEISAYPAYLGLFRLESRNGKKVFRLSESAKRFLIVEEPNVPAFMILQMLLFQYPNGMGATYRGNRMQDNAAKKTLSLVKNGIHLSPFRLICKALLADSILNGVSPLSPFVTFEEVYTLANDTRVNTSCNPSKEIVSKVLQEVREGLIQPPVKFERRFHILNHTDLLQTTNGRIHLRETYSPEDKELLLKKLWVIDGVYLQFDGFDNATSVKDLEEIVNSGEWGRYFDGVVSLTSDIVQALTSEYNDLEFNQNSSIVQESDEIIVDNSKIKLNYPLRERDSFEDYNSHVKRKNQIADPEVTRIKRQRSNLEHKILTQKMDEFLRKIGANPHYSEHIDIFAAIPNDGNFIFEIKSVSPENLLSQTRKGLSQLYEYRFRYKSIITGDITLCLVLPREPNDIEWLQEYLCTDRDVAVCWFTEDDQLNYPKYCEDKISKLLLSNSDNAA